MQTNISKLATTNLELIPESWVLHNDVEYALAKFDHELRLVLHLGSEKSANIEFEGSSSITGNGTLFVAPMNSNNAAVLRTKLPWLNPQLVGLKTSAGMGDRLGLATPGHVRAIKKTEGRIVPVLAQQSIREMSRTGRTAQQVMDDAMWGVFRENWQDGFGSDADHLKATDDIDVGLAAGFTMFTIDPGDHVDKQAETAERDILLSKIAALPEEIRSIPGNLENRTISIEDYFIVSDEISLLRAMAKYGRAVWHVKCMFDHLCSHSEGRPFELEVSVDETDQPTNHLEHIYIASELKRLGVEWVSLAPRFIGTFEKGVDYIGDVQAFEESLQIHAAIARAFGPYKISLHSGSDKFSIYAASMRQTQGLVHLKTAGTSYLEALRTIAALDEGLFKEIYAFACERYDADKVSYHVSAMVDRAPEIDKVKHWPDILDQFDAREILHVTFGSVLRTLKNDGSSLFYDRFMKILSNNPEVYADFLEKHFQRHFQPFLDNMN